MYYDKFEWLALQEYTAPEMLIKIFEKYVDLVFKFFIWPILRQTLENRNYTFRSFCCFVLHVNLLIAFREFVGFNKAQLKYQAVVEKK